MQYKKIVIAITTNMLGTFSLLAAPVWMQNGLMGISMGMGIPNTPSLSSITNADSYPPDLYSANDSSTIPIIDIFLGKRSTLFNHAAVMAIHYNTNLYQTTQGMIDEFSDSRFWNYRYNYSITRYTLLGEYQWNLLSLENNNKAQPYLLLGLGLSSNTLGNYSEQPEPNVIYPRDSMNFARRTLTQVAFEAGLGMSYRLNANWDLDAECTYLNAGDAALGANNIGNFGPKQKLVYTTFMTGVRYSI